MGPMSRCSSLYQALAKASANSSGSSRKRREIFSYSGSRRRARSVVSIVGGRLSEPSSGSGTVFAPAPSLGCHWCAPAGLFVSSHSKAKRFSKNSLLHRVGVLGPGDLDPARDGVAALARAVLALPADALVLDRAALGLRPDEVGVAGAVGLAEGVAAGDERHGLLVVHRHPGERVADVARGLQRVGLAVGALRVDVDQAHLHGAERVRSARGRRCSARRRARRPPDPRRPPRAPRRPRGRSRTRRS